LGFRSRRLPNRTLDLMPVDPSARIHPSAEIAASAMIGANVEIGPDCVVGDDCEVMAGAVLGPRVKMGARNRVHYHAIIGEEPQFLGFDPATPSGVDIGDGNEFREMCTVHRGLKPDGKTVIGSNNFIMAQSHIAHDCVLGDNVVLANCGLLAGHVEVGNGAFISGQVAVHQFCRIGRLAMVGGQTGINQDVPPFVMCRGNVGRLFGLNVVGLRRAGVSAATRIELKQAFKALFMSDRRPADGARDMLDRYSKDDRDMPAEVTYLLNFCMEKSRRGLTTKLAIDTDRSEDGPSD
jgi:UDP-N-acetylglucosamine acyltransferase